MTRHKAFSENISVGSRGSGRSKISSMDSFTLPTWAKDSNMVQAVMIRHGCTEGKARELLRTLQLKPGNLTAPLRQQLYAIVKSGICGGTK